MEVSEIIESVDILDYISQYCEFEEKNGEYWALSPLKDEKTPSFSVNTEKQCFYDFSSGTGGNVINFIEKYHNCDFPKALKILISYAGVNENEIQITDKRLLSAKIAKQFRRKSKPIKEAKYSLLESDCMDKYEYNEKKFKPWIDEGISIDSINRFSVRYDKFSNRLVFPIKNINGSIINICGRTLDEDFKSKKLRKYTYFKPLGILDTIYGFSDNVNDIFKKKEIILFEGAKSVMIADTWGIHNTGALLTSHLNEHQMMLLIKLGIRVVFALDEDVNIENDKYINKLKKYVKIEKVVNLNNLLSPKMSPVDAGKDVWDFLYEKREPIN